MISCTEVLQRSIPSRVGKSNKYLFKEKHPTHYDVSGKVTNIYGISTLWIRTAALLTVSLNMDQ